MRTLSRRIGSALPHRAFARQAVIGLAVAAALFATDAFRTVDLLGQWRAAVFWTALVGLNVVGWIVWRKLFGHEAMRGLRLLAAGALLNLVLAVEVPVLFRALGRFDAGLDWRTFCYGLLASCFVAYVRRPSVPLHVETVAPASASPTEGAPSVADRASPAGILARAGLAGAAERAAVRAEDHYCRLLLRNGRSVLVHYRFKDAVADLAAQGGAQVHRSVWVAGDAVLRARREGRRWSLELAGGTIVPVSETSISLCRARGWLTAGNGSA